jgi:hypothetical protein
MKVVSGEYNFPEAYNKVVSTSVDSVQAVHPFAISQMPSRLSLARTFRRLAASLYPSVPHDSNSIIFPERWLKLRGNPTAESFVLINLI